MYKLAKFDQTILCGSIVMSILLTDHNWRDVKMYKYAKFDQNIPYGSRVMSIHIKRINLLK